jgi:hypothetical protein
MAIPIILAFLPDNLRKRIESWLDTHDSHAQIW